MNRTILAVVVVFAAAANSLFASGLTPCDPDRPFCGRLLVIITGAGERANPGQTVNADGTVDGDADENDAFSDFMQMRRQSEDGLFSQAVVISSDKQLEARLLALPESIRAESGFLGVSAASPETFQEFIDDNSKSSLLSAAIRNFEADPGCQALKASRGANSVIPFLMVQIHITGENAKWTNYHGEPAIPLWPKKGMVGSYEHWKAAREQAYQETHLPNKLSLNQTLISGLLQKLDGAVVLALLSFCEASRMGLWFNRDGMCSGFLGATDDKQADTTSGSVATPWAFVMNDVGEGVRSMHARSPGGENLAAMVPGSFRKYERLDRRDDPLTPFADYNNPLNGFIYSSVDADVDRILTRVPKSHKLADAAQRLREAEFAFQIPSEPAFVSKGLDPSQRDAVKSLCRGRDAYKAQFRAIVAEELGKPDLRDIDLGFKAFLECLDLNDPQPAACKIIVEEFLGPAYADVERETFMASMDHQHLAETASYLFKALNQEGMRELITRYEKGEINIAQFFVKLKRVWGEYIEFRKVLAEQAEARYHAPLASLPPDIQKARHAMHDSFASSYYTVETRLFPLLRQEVLKVRLAKLDAAVNLLAANVTPDAESDIKELTQALALLVDYPVGPAFDEKYGRKMREFLKHPPAEVSQPAQPNRLPSRQ